ncbi:hypothetical protein OROMI_017818 [Orobanche minor]
MWSFLDDMMRILNFDSKWRMWMLECVSSASANVLINGSPSGEFKLERGLRQGDPLSPFLFLIVAEGLSLLVTKAVEEGLLEAASIGNDQVPVANLQYADDTIFMVSDNPGNAWAIKCLLKNFELASGLRVNFDKCSLMGVNVDVNMMREMAETLQCELGCIPFSYLGVRVGINHKRIAEWDHLVHKMKTRLKSWEHKKLSLGGRITILKAVLTAIPIYQLSFYCLPKTILSELTKLQRTFLWGGSVDVRKTAWISWESITSSKDKGGLGVRDLRFFNNALMGKWLWFFLSNKNCLWVKILSSVYGTLRLGEGGVVSTSNRNCWSSWWGDVVKIGNGVEGKWFRDNVARFVGNGRSTKFWEDIWIGSESLKSAFPRLYRLSLGRESFIAGMGEWVGGEWVWKWEWRRNLFGREESSFNNLLALLTSCRLSEHTNDRWVWRPTSDGNYSTSSAYDEAVRQEVAVVNAAVHGVRFAKVWNKIVPLKVASLTWRTMWDRIPTKKNLVHVNHIFLGCPMVREVWDNMYSWIGITTVQHKDVKHHFEAHSGLVKGKKKASFMNGAFCVRKIVDEIKVVF